jgi:hypothetical protein
MHGASAANHRDRLRPLPRLERRPERSAPQPRRVTERVGERPASAVRNEFDHFVDELRALGFQF